MPQGISIVLPAYNEDENLQVAVDRALEVMPDLISDFEVIIVDDGSTDGTRLQARSSTLDKPKNPCSGERNRAPETPGRAFFMPDPG